MNYEAFCSGAGDSLMKEAGVMDWVRQNIFQPAVQGHIDAHYGGIGRYNATTGAVEPHTMNAIRAVTGVSSIFAKPTADGGRIRQGLYNLGSSQIGKWIGNKLVPNSVINANVNTATRGVFSLDGTGVQVDHSKIPGALFDRLKNWSTSHSGLLKGMGFGAAALGLGALALNNRNSRPQPQVASPAGQQPAPYTGREGNTFTKYQEI